MLNALQKATAQAIVNIFETGRVIGDYGQVTLLAGDSGHLTYGRAQTTLASGNLDVLIRGYCAAPGARYAPDLVPYLERLAVNDLSLDHDWTFRALLREAGEDPVMQRQQDGFFDRVYWRPALASAAYIGAERPLGIAVIYDSRIHGSWHALRDRTIAAHGTLEVIGEADWMAHYVETRRQWLAGHGNTLLRKTVYRMQAFAGLFDENAWDLALPLTVRGLLIDKESLQGKPPLRATAADSDRRTLKLVDPLMHGDDVRALQAALAEAGFAVDVDGYYGRQCADAVRAFQSREGLVADGIAGPATYSSLYDDD